jgi:hypothetical protein
VQACRRRSHWLAEWHAERGVCVAVCVLLSCNPVCLQTTMRYCRSPQLVAVHCTLCAGAGPPSDASHSIQHALHAQPCPAQPNCLLPRLVPLPCCRVCSSAPRWLDQTCRRLPPVRACSWPSPGWWPSAAAVAAHLPARADESERASVLSCGGLLAGWRAPPAPPHIASRHAELLVLPPFVYTCSPCAVMHGHPPCILTAPVSPVRIPSTTCSTFVTFHTTSARSLPVMLPKPPTPHLSLPPHMYPITRPADAILPAKTTLRSHSSAARCPARGAHSTCCTCCDCQPIVLVSWTVYHMKLKLKAGWLKFGAGNEWRGAWRAPEIAAW